MKALIFDLDGTLIDTVFAHVLAWQCSSFTELKNITVAAWSIHQKISLPGRILSLTIGCESNQVVGSEEAAKVDQPHSEILKDMLPETLSLSGAIELIR
jgi:beta-phosphoglucomutase-like phosphatase (HAD superfamily)